MIVYVPIGGGSGSSIDPGEGNVLDGVPYNINGTPLVGTLSLSFPTALQIAAAVWSEPILGYTDSTKFGGFVKKLLTVAKFLGLK